MEGWFKGGLNSFGIELSAAQLPSPHPFRAPRLRAAHFESVHVGNEGRDGGWGNGGAEGGRSAFISRKPGGGGSR